MWAQGGHPRQGRDDGDGRAAADAQRPRVPPNGLLLGNPQSTLLDADGSLWRILHPNGLNGKYWIGSQPGQRFHDLMEQARYTLDPRKRKAALHRGDPDHPRGEAVARAVPGDRRLRHEQARELQAARGLPADRRRRWRRRDEAGARAGVAAGRDRRGALRADAGGGGAPSAPARAAAEIQLPPGFRVQVYVTGEGFDTSQERSARGVPAVSTLAFDPTGAPISGARGAATFAGGEVEDDLAHLSIPRGRQPEPEDRGALLPRPAALESEGRRHPRRARAVRHHLRPRAEDRRALPDGRRARRAVRGRNAGRARRAALQAARGRRPWTRGRLLRRRSGRARSCGSTRRAASSPRATSR